MNRVRRLLADLAGRTDTVFVDLLTRQVDCGIEACEALGTAVDERIDPADAARQVKDIEHRADAVRQALIDELSQVLTTPLDREDLFRFSRGVDDVVDNLRDFADALELFTVADAAPCRRPLAEVERGLRALREAVEELRTGPASVPVVARRAKRQSQVREAFLAGVAEVLTGEVTTDMLRLRELLRRLDVVGLRLGQAADVLSDAALKRA